MGMAKVLGQGASVRSSEGLLKMLQGRQGLGASDTRDIAHERLRKGQTYINDAERAIFGDAAVPSAENDDVLRPIASAIGSRPSPNPAAPAPAALPSQNFDPASLPGMVKTRTNVSAHTRAVKKKAG